MTIPSPIAPKHPHPITQHGLTRIDNYYWMRDRRDPEVLNYLRAENEYLDQTMAETRLLQQNLFEEMKARIQEDDTSVPEFRDGYFYYRRNEAGKQYPIYCRKHGSLDAPEQILLDQNLLAEGKPFCRLGSFSVSPDGNKLAYSIDPDGSEICTLYVLDLTTGKLLPETFPNTYGDVYGHDEVEWSNDSRTFFYITLDDALRPYKLFRHALGTDPTQDTLIFHETDETFFLFISKTRDRSLLLTEHYSTTSTEVRFMSADDPTSELCVLQPRLPGLEYSADHHNGTFFIVTNDNARNFKLVSAPVTNPGKENWREIVPHREQVLLDTVDVFEDYLVLRERKDGLKQIRISALDGQSRVRYVEFPEPAYDVWLMRNPDFKTDVLRFSYSSLITPQSIVDYQIQTGEWVLKKQEQIPSGYDASNYVSERIFATSADGRRVPISIVYRKGLKKDGSHPALLYGYGSYGAVRDASFSSNTLSLIDRGYVYAIGHVRGGSELGREWYEDGKMLRKKNSFNDFIACAEHLIAQGYTSKEKLAIVGGSAGGLLVSASMTLRPDLFKAVIAQVPFVDVVTSMSDPTIPLTTLEYDQWGNPENKDHFDYMLSYSPYDNLRPTRYPHLLITTGLNDPRVAYWEPAKFTAKLRELKTDGNRLLLKTNYDSGHAGASGRYDFLKDVALEYAFLIDTLGTA